MSEFDGNNAGAAYVLDIVMLNAHKISSLLMERQTLKDGNHLQLIQMLVPDNTVPAALRWISGRPTLSLRPTLLIHVLLMDQKDAKVIKNVVLEIKDSMVSAIKMVAILTHTDLESKISMDQE